MAGFVQNLLKEAESGFFGNDYVRDFTHASKTFVTDSYGYAPKYKFLFHVYFDINEKLIPAAATWPADHNFGLTVKTVQLPKFTMDLHTMNQYNRKRIVQTKIKYDPVNLVLHDDNHNLMTKLWHAYYTYYFKDGAQKDPFANAKSTSAGGAADLNKRNIYNSSIAGDDDWGYIGEAATANQIGASMGVSKTPFFRAINIYGFNQHNFTLYRLINPMIESFSHDTYEYASANGTMEHQMTLQYESVKYYEGAVDGRAPSDVVKGFGTNDHYDTKISPIAQPGSNATIIGQGGLLDAAGGILDDLDQGKYLAALRTAGQTLKTFNNPKSVVNAAKSDVLGAVNNSLKGTPNRTMFSFPTGEASDMQKAQKAVDSTIGNAVK
jgi:hypothetical protein